MVIAFLSLPLQQSTSFIFVSAFFISRNENACFDTQSTVIFMRYFRRNDVRKVAVHIKVSKVDSLIVDQ